MRLEFVQINTHTHQSLSSIYTSNSIETFFQPEASNLFLFSTFLCSSKKTVAQRFDVVANADPHAKIASLKFVCGSCAMP